MRGDRKVETFYAQNLEGGMVLQDGRIITEVEVGERWVWVKTSSGTDAFRKFQLVRVVDNIYST